MEYYSTIKKNEIMLSAATWMELESVILNKSDREGKISYDLPYMWNLKGNDRNEFTYKTERDSQTQNELMVAGVGGKDGGKG